MRRTIVSFGFDGQRRLYGDGRAAGFFGAAMLLLGISVVAQEAIYGDMISRPLGGFFVSLILFCALASHAFSDFMVGYVAPAFVGAVRALALIVMCGVAVFYVTSYVVTGDIVALGVLALGIAVMALILFARWLVSRSRRGRDDTPPRSPRPGDK